MSKLLKDQRLDEIAGTAFGRQLEFYASSVTWAAYWAAHTAGTTGSLDKRDLSSFTWLCQVRDTAGGTLLATAAIGTGDAATGTLTLSLTGDTTAGLAGLTFFELRETTADKVWGRFTVRWAPAVTVEP